MGKRWTKEDLKQLRPDQIGVEKKPGKYGNKKTVTEGIEFDSKKEAARYLELVILQRAGEISGLRRQVTYGLTVNGELICSYVADFVYRAKSGVVIEDVKSEETRKLPVYRIKNKLMAACHGIYIKEV